MGRSPADGDARPSGCVGSSSTPSTASTPRSGDASGLGNGNRAATLDAHHNAHATDNTPTSGFNLTGTWRDAAAPRIG